MKKLFFVLLAIAGFLYFEDAIYGAIVFISPIILYFTIFASKRVFNFCKIYRAAKLIDKGKTDKAVAILKKMQTPIAYCMLGTVYQPHNFTGLDYSDSNESFKWFYRAAEEGHVTGQFEISQLYWLGDGVEQSNIFAYMWATILNEYNAYRKKEVKILLDLLEKEMTDEELAEAQSHISNKFAKGTVHFRNYKKAIKYLFKAAENGHLDSILLLETLYGGANTDSAKNHPLAKFFDEDENERMKWNKKFIDRTNAVAD